MAFHVKRTRTVDNEKVVQYQGGRESHWVPPLAGRSVLEIQYYPKPQSLPDVPDDKNTMVPPYHWHWYQQEYFHITSGRFIFTLEGKDRTVSATDPQPVKIPPHARHTFKVDRTCEEPCRIEISTDASPRGKDATAAEDDFGINEMFFRNIYSYLDDCTHQNVAPSLPQLLLFLHSGEVSLAFPGPRWLANPLSYLFGLAVGVGVGEYLLGYKRTYPEYYDPSRATSKKNR